MFCESFMGFGEMFNFSYEVFGNSFVFRDIFPSFPVIGSLAIDRKCIDNIPSYCQCDRENDMNIDAHPRFRAE